MNNKNIIKITLDIVMTILFITFFNKNLISIEFHIISGCIFMVFMLIHMFLNRRLIINISKRLFDNKLKLRFKISYILSIFLFMAILVITISGMPMMKVLDYDKEIFWKTMHLGVSYLSIALIVGHIVAYWKSIINILQIKK